jgi:hypothetical protein
MRTRLFTEGSDSRKLLPKAAYAGRLIGIGTAFSLKIWVKERPPHRFQIAKAILFSSTSCCERRVAQKVGGAAIKIPSRLPLLLAEAESSGVSKTKTPAVSDRLGFSRTVLQALAWR